MDATTARITATKAALTPMPAFDPVERSLLLGVVLLDWLVDIVIVISGSLVEVVPMRWLLGVGEGTVEDLAAGLAARVVVEPAAAIFSDSCRRLMISVSVDCHRTWMKSAQTLLLPVGMSVCVTVSREGEVGSGPGASVDVEKTFARSVPMRLTQP